MPLKRAPNKKNDSAKKEFVWSDNEAELLLSVTHEYKTNNSFVLLCSRLSNNNRTTYTSYNAKRVAINRTRTRSLLGSIFEHTTIT